MDGSHARPRGAGDMPGHIREVMEKWADVCLGLETIESHHLEKGVYDYSHAGVSITVFLIK